MSKFLSILILTLLLSSCSVMRNSPRTKLSDGLYSDKTQSKEKVYVHSEDELILIYPTKNEERKLKVDTINIIYRFHQEKVYNTK